MDLSAFVVKKICLLKYYCKWEFRI